MTEQEINVLPGQQLVKDDDATRREQVRSRLQSQKIAAQREAFVKALRSQAKVAVHLTPPPVQRIQMNVDGALSRRRHDAPVTIVEFADTIARSANARRTRWGRSCRVTAIESG